MQDNPVGPDPVDNYSRNGYNWQTVQAGGASIFPGVTTCPNFATDPKLPEPDTDFNVFSVNQNFRTPYFYNYNLNVEKSLGSAAVLQVGYVGSEAHKLSVIAKHQPEWALLATRSTRISAPILQLNSIGTSNYNSLQTTLRIRSWHGLTGAVRLHLGACAGRSDRIPRGDSARQLTT